MKIFIFVLLAALLPVVVSAQRPDTTGAAALFHNMMSQINPRHVSWVKKTASSIYQDKQPDIEAKDQASRYAIPGNMNDADIEALCFLVLMQVAKSSQEDLKSIMARVKDINKQKAAQREMLSRMQKSQAMSKAQLDSFKLLSNKTKAIQKGHNPDTVRLVKTNTGMRTVQKAEMDAMTEQIKKDLDSMSEMGEMESLRLQMAMDRMSKMMSTLSNLLKKISDTAQGITQNLK